VAAGGLVSMRYQQCPLGFLVARFIRRNKRRSWFFHGNAERPGGCRIPTTAAVCAPVRRVLISLHSGPSEVSTAAQIDSTVVLFQSCRFDGEMARHCWWANWSSGLNHY